MKFHGGGKEKKKSEGNHSARAELCGMNHQHQTVFFYKSMQQFVYLGQHSFSKQTSTKFAQEKSTYVWGRDPTSQEEERPGSF